MRKWTQAEEFRWLLDHPDFKERPASLEEFLGPKYLNIDGMVRPGIKQALVDIFGQEVSGRKISQAERAIVTGGIGIGKTTLASIALPYMVHWVLCLKDPQKFYHLLPGSRIAFMQMSTSEDQAREVIFGDIKARIANSPWFQKYPPDPKFTKSIRWADKDIWILPGDSAETTFEGYNILGGVLDEADSHKVTKDKDYAEQGYQTIESRIASRFVDNSDPDREGHLGLLIVIGQMKKGVGFAANKYSEMLEDPHAVAVRMTIWESFGWDKYSKNNVRNSFLYDVKRRQIIRDEVKHLLIGTSKDLLEIPNAFKQQFKTHPEKALKDLAGIPPTSEDPFISQAYKIDEAFEKWEELFGKKVPVSESCTRPEIASWVKATNTRRRAGHLDIGYSSDGDAAGLAFGHVHDMVEGEDGDVQPFIVFDVLIRVKAPIGGEVQLSDLRGYIYQFKDRGFRINRVTLDGFQSTDTMQLLRKKRIPNDYLSVDKSKAPYEDLRDALNENRIAFPKYMTILQPGQTEPVDIVTRELTGLSDVGNKIDHPKDGSKDVADAMAGVVNRLMMDNSYRRGVSSQASSSEPEEEFDLKAHMDKFLAGAMAPPLQDGKLVGGLLNNPNGIETPRLAPGIAIPDRLRKG